MNESHENSSSSWPANLYWLIDTYFSDPQKRIELKKGELLMREGEINERLYLVVSGVLLGYTTSPEGGRLEAFRATRHRFVGIPSFFSKLFTTLTTVEAEEDSVVAYIDQNQETVSDGHSQCLPEQFMPVMVMELIHRQSRIQKVGLEKEKALKALIHSEKMVSLGQIAAGIAHELNNAVAVVKRNVDWLSQNFSELLREMYPGQTPYFVIGLKEGRKVSSRESRQRAKALHERYGIDEDIAYRIAQTGISDEQLTTVNDWRGIDLERMIHFWEIGATLSDTLIASHHAVHVVKSIKDLGAQRSERSPGLDLNECISEALTLLASPIRRVTLEQELHSLPTIIGNKGEIVQVLINIMQNACESMASDHTPNPLLRIQSDTEDGDILLRICDNGPGIPLPILPHIFEPSITTKTNGRTVGLGLGLTIAQRIVDSYGGTVRAESRPGKTLFTLRIPFGGNHVKTQHPYRG